MRGVWMALSGLELAETEAAAFGDDDGIGRSERAQLLLDYLATCFLSLPLTHISLP